MNGVLFDGVLSCYASGGVHVEKLINIWTVFDLDWFLDDDVEIVMVLLFKFKI